MTVHPTAFVHHLAHVSNSLIEADCRIWQFASVVRGTRLGRGCSVAPGAHLDGPQFGAGCVIGHNIAMGPGFIFGEACFIGPGVVVCNDSWPAADKDGWDGDALFRALDNPGGLVTVRAGDRVGIGANAVILPGVTLGDDCFVAAGATVTHDLPAGHLWTRDGEVRAINPAWARRRMRAAR